jgi:hypothetical protein
VRAGALERDGPHRGGVEPSSEADLARGGIEPSSEADPARGGAQPSSEADLTRGAFRCAFLAGCWATRAVIVSCVCFRFMG